MEQDAIYSKLMEISEDIGELKALQAQTNQTLIGHIAEDRLGWDRVSKLEATGQRQAGAVKVVATLGTFVGALGGIFGSLFVRHH